MRFWAGFEVGVPCGFALAVLLMIAGIYYTGQQKTIAADFYAPVPDLSQVPELAPR